MPLLFLPGQEFDKIKQAMEPYTSRFSDLRLGCPLFSDPKELRRFAAVLMGLSPPRAEESTIFMGHGTTHFSDLVYPALQTMFYTARRMDLQVATLKGWPKLEDILPHIHTKTVTLRPLMLTAGRHVQTDLAIHGKKYLEHAGFEVVPVLQGLEEFPEICTFYVQHLRSESSGVLALKL